MSVRNVGQVLSIGAPDRDALVTRSGTWTYRQLDALADRGRDALWALGVRPGDRVGVALPNDVDVVVAFHGLMRLGGVWVGVNRNLASPEQAWLLADSAAALFLDEARLDEWADALATAPEVEVPDVDPFAPAGIAYTSGTTGRPKGAVHSQHNLLQPGAALVESRGWGADLRKGDCFPLTILNLQVLATLTTAQAGGCSIVMDRIDADGVAEWIRRERVTTWNGPPALLHSLVERDDVTAEDLSSLDEVWTGGGDCPEALRDRFEAKFGVAVTSTYGLTEAPSVVTIDPKGAHVPGASGRPLPHLDVTIVDGEICVGPAPGGDYRLMLGYLDRPDATAEVLAGDVLHTGDVGELDADGFLHVRDRRSLVIIRGGANVYPAEVERVLGEAPGVRACAVLGIPDERLGERVVAVVEGDVDVEAVLAHCREQLARYKVPERLAVVGALPRNAMGKVVRAELPALVSHPAPPPGPTG